MKCCEHTSTIIIQIWHSASSKCPKVSKRRCPLNQGLARHFSQLVLSREPIQRPASMKDQNPGKFPGFGGMMIPPNVGKFPAILGTKQPACGGALPRPNSRILSRPKFNPCLMLTRSGTRANRSSAFASASRRLRLRDNLDSNTAVSRTYRWLLASALVC